jgi:hypothetical protein
MRCHDHIRTTDVIMQTESSDMGELPQTESRAAFLRSLVETHRAKPSRDEGWQIEEAAYVEAIAVAELQLEDLKRRS